jgi:uncharacterized repeat protein (TIGR03803 family)
MMCGSAVSAQIYSDLYEFGGAPDGCCPQYPMVMAQAGDGNVYGVTSTGGSNNVGVVFKISPSGGYSAIYNFDTVHGSTPVGGLTLGTDGQLYGTTQLGGANGDGNIFKVTTAGAFTVLYDFTGAADGGFPVAPLTLALDGNFYGTSYPGYAFRMTPDGVFSVIGAIPAASYGPLLQASDRNFYGVTQFGGTFSAGTVYQIAGTRVTTLYNFDGPHGADPIGGLVEGTDGYLYGTTTAGGGSNAGVVYRITTAGDLTVVVDFDSVHDQPGYQTYAGLVAANDGNLYGATIFGGLNDAGTLFQLTTDGTYTVLYNFDPLSLDGAYATPMQHTTGVLFGMTKRGGALGKGGIYSLDDGVAPYVSLVSPGGRVGMELGILGQGFSTASSVEFNGTPASFRVASDTFLQATVPSGETGFVTIHTSSGTLFSKQIFKVTPQITGFSPIYGTPGTQVILTGAGLIQTENITVGGVKVTAYTVNSDTKLTFPIPAGAKTGNIVVTTPGGIAAGNQIFTLPAWTP